MATLIIFLTYALLFWAAFWAGEYQDLVQVCIILSLLAAGVVRLLEWIVRLFTEGVRWVVEQVELVVKTTWTLLFVSGLIAKEILWYSYIVLCLVLIGLAVTLAFLQFLWVRFHEIRHRDKNLHTTLCIALWTFTLVFFFEVVPPYDDPRAYFTYHFYIRSEWWMTWVCGRVIRWFALSGL